MKRYINIRFWRVFFFIIFCCHFVVFAEVSNIDISANHVRGSNNYIAFNITIPSISKKEIQLDMPNEWADATELEKNFFDLSENIVYKNKKWYLLTNQAKSTSYSYKISHSNDHWFNPKIFSDIFCLIGHTAFILPIQESNKEMNVTIKWNKALPSHVVANSFGTNQALQKFKASNNLLKNALFIGGEIKLLDITNNINDSKIAHYTVALYPKSLRGSALYKIMQDIIIAQNSNFKVKLPDDYLSAWLSIPSQLGDKGQATHLFNSQVFYQNNSFSFDENNYIRLFSHENLHYWIGRILKASDDNYLQLNWFFEGFTDYLGFLISVENDILEKKEYIKIFNKYLKHHYSEKAHKDSFEKICKNYWKTPEYSTIPYIKGHIFAAKIDMIIKSESNYKHSLKSVIQGLFDDGYDEVNGKRLNQHEILKNLDSFTNGQASFLWKEHFAKAKLIIPPAELFYDIAILEQKNGIPQYQLINHH